MAYDQVEKKFDRHAADKDNSGAQEIARQAYNPSSKMNWNLQAGTQDTSASVLPSMSLDTNGTTGSGAAAANDNAAASTTQSANSFMSGITAAESTAPNPVNDNAAAGAATDAQSSSNPLMAGLQQINQEIQTINQQIQALEAQLGLPASSGGTSPESQTTPPQSQTQPAESLTTTPSGSQTGDSGATTTTPVDSTTTPATNTTTAVTGATPPSEQSTNPAASDATIQALQATDPQAAQLLTAMEPAQSGMSSTGFSQYESAFGQIMQGGQYADVGTAANAANAQLQGSGDTADATIAGNVISNTINASNDAAVSTYSPTNDPTVQALQASDPEAAQILTSLQPSQSGMTAAGYSQFENNFNQQIQTGGWADVASAGNAAATQLQSNGDSADANIAQTAVTNITTQNGDATLSTATQPASTTTTDTQPTSTSTDTQPTSTSTDTQPTSTSTDTQPASTTTADTSPTTTPTDTTTTTPTTSTATASGGYNVINGQIIGPNGQPFQAKGVAVFASQAAGEAATIMQAMPDLNFIRLASTPGTDSPADVQAAIQAFQKINPNVVVEVEDHTSGGTDGTTNNTLSGEALTNEENWYAQIASANVNNPNVWFGTANEPNDPSNEQDVVDQEVGIYNAVRGTGNNSMVMLEAQGGGFFAPQQADPGAYANMTNVAWDDHYYGWETNGDTSVADNITAIQNEIAGSAGITESDGNGGQQKIPTIMGEYGDSTTGNGIDANGSASVAAVQTASNEGIVQGSVGWIWNGNNNPTGADELTSDGTLNTLTSFGNEVINYVNTGNVGNADNQTITQ